MTVILDCNIWITLTINSQIDFIADLSDNAIIIASCGALRHEIISVLNRPKLAKFISPTDIDKITELHDLVVTNYRPGKIKPVTNDPKDDYLFALAANCNADFLVTGDKLLLEVDRYKKTSIITLARFKQLLK
jgi:putative PIN family toxin of toxin-antitoxin system